MSEAAQYTAVGVQHVHRALQAGVERVHCAQQLKRLLWIGDGRADQRLGEGVGRAEVLAVVSIVVGIVGLAIAVPKRQVTMVDARDIVDLWLPLAVLALAAVAPYLVRNWRDAGSRLVILGAGFALRSARSA